MVRKVTSSNPRHVVKIQRESEVERAKKKVEILSVYDEVRRGSCKERDTDLLRFGTSLLVKKVTSSNPRHVIQIERESEREREKK